MKTGEFVKEGAVFMCRACLVELPAGDSSPDPRYCKECYSFLRNESKGHNANAPWIPIEDKHRMVPDITILPGDRVQVVGEVDSWMVVDGINGDDVVVKGISHSNGIEPVPEAVATIRIDHVYAHQIKEGKKVKRGATSRETTPQENLIRCRETLTKVVANNADPRVIGLWKAKVAQAEKLCEDVGKSGKDADVVKKGGLATTIGVLVSTLAGTSARFVSSAEPNVAGMRKSADAQKSIDVQPQQWHNPCKCGCGGPAAKGRNFLAGHDARFAGYIRKLDKKLVAVEALPQLVREMVEQNHELVQRARSHK